MIEKFYIMKVDDNFLKGNTWDKEAILKTPFSSIMLGKGKGNFKNEINAMSFRSRGEGYEKQLISATRSSAMKMFSSLKNDGFQVLQLSCGKFLSFQQQMTVNDKSLMTEFAKFVENDLDLKMTTKPDHYMFQDVISKHIAYMFILRDAKCKYHGYICVRHPKGPPKFNESLLYLQTLQPK